MRQEAPPLKTTPRSTITSLLEALGAAFLEPRISRQTAGTTYILGSLLVRIFGEGEGLREGARPFLQLPDDEDQADRERHPRRHVVQPATINMMGWRSLTLLSRPVLLHSRFPTAPVKTPRCHGTDKGGFRAINLSIPFGRSPP